uniref:TPR_REGION domain-containing protein n=1 Tax=Caenorhabditis japonica TaxID=281687 RepID=A0A8R1E6J7_CAEJA
MSDLPSTSTYVAHDEEDPETMEDDVTFEGVDVASHLRISESQSENESASKNAEDRDLVHAINMFMRNEYDYDEFMRVTGGQTLQEEMGGATKVRRYHNSHREDDVEEVYTGDDDEGEDDEDVELMEEVEATPSLSATTPSMANRYDALPEEARVIMTELMAEGLGPNKNLSDVLQAQFDTIVPPLKQIKLESVQTKTTEGESAAPTSSSNEESSRVGRETHNRGKTKRLDALLGQANVQAARGNTADAMELLREVIRQDHKHAMAYHQIATVYEQMGEHQKALQFGLLASHLDHRTPSDDWLHWGDEAKRFGMFEEAAVCYDRALHLKSDNWLYYEKRIEMLEQLDLRPLAMRTRLQAAQMIDHQLADVGFRWFHDLIRKVAQYYITMNDEEKAILALEAFVLRSREFGEKADAQHETLVNMYLSKNNFQSAGKSIVSLCKGIKVVKMGTDDSACV